MNIASPHYWPAEWEPQAATWISWPHNAETWPDRFSRIPPVFIRLISILAESQEVHVLSGHPSDLHQAERSLGGLKNVFVHHFPTNDCWIRDYGPTFVRRSDDHSLVGIDWKYNAWGGKYSPYDLDAGACELICRYLRSQRSVSAMYCEGGALDTDGMGTLLTTSSCLMSPTRNPGWTKEMVESELRLQLGVSKILWVDGGGLEGDDTDGHIDQLARFVSRQSVVVSVSSSQEDPNYSKLATNHQILREATDARGETLRVYPLPTPPPRKIESQRVPESYCNFLIANEVVIMPTFGSNFADAQAQEILSDLFPSRTIVPLDATDLVWGLGTFHCASQHQPATASEAK